MTSVLSAMCSSMMYFTVAPAVRRRIAKCHVSRYFGSGAGWQCPIVLLGK